MLTEKDHSIIRQTCIKAVCELVAAKAVALDQAFEFAGKMEKWVLDAPTGIKQIPPLIGEDCLTCKVPMKHIPSGISKKGFPYSAFWVCDNCKATKQHIQPF
mgnify:CR=1 FL=1